MQKTVCQPPRRLVFFFWGAENKSVYCLIYFTCLYFGANRKTKLNVHRRDRNAKIDDPAPTVQSPPLN